METAPIDNRDLGHSVLKMGCLAAFHASVSRCINIVTESVQAYEKYRVSCSALVDLATSLLIIIA